MASGAAAARSANSWWTVAPRGWAAAVSFHSPTTWARWAAERSGSAEIDRPGSAAAAARSVRRPPASRRTVVRSKRSALYSISPASPAAVSAMNSASSNLATPSGTPAGRAITPPRSSSARGALWSEKRTWKIGCRELSRPGCSSATRRSKGTSWWANAPSAASRTRPTSAANDGSPARSTRSARVLTKKPISSSSSRRVRPAVGVPTTTSPPPDSRPRSAAKPARSTM